MKPNHKPKLILGLASLAAWAFLWPAAVSAQTSFTATGWVNGVPAPGIWATNALGQVICRGIVQTAQVQSPDARLAGQVFVICDASANADGTANMQGQAYLQVGTWDAAGTNFTPSGGVWALNWRGVMQTDYSFQLSQAGYGIGGGIDGLRLQETVTRGPAANAIDPTVPWLYAGTIKPPAVSTTLFADSFDTGVTGWTTYHDLGVANLYSTNQQLLMRADWTGAGGSLQQHTFWAFAPGGSWAPANGQTVEGQADLVSISQNSTNVAWVDLGDGVNFYVFAKSRNWVFMGRGVGHNATVFWLDNTVQLSAQNVRLSLRLTRDGANMIVTTRVLDKESQNAVVFERSFVDTPGVDASLTTAQFAALTGTTTFGLVPDPGPPVLAGTTRALCVAQFTDGNQPPLEAVWDNFSVRLHDVPPLGIARAVQLSWPAPAGVNYSLEAAPTVLGPWLPVQDMTMPGRNQMTMPVSGPAGFFRLIPAP
jgi:hypothetical protein